MSHVQLAGLVMTEPRPDADHEERAAAGYDRDWSKPADPAPAVIEGYANPEGSGEGNWSRQQREDAHFNDPEWQGLGGERRDEIDFDTWVPPRPDFSKPPAPGNEVWRREDVQALAPPAPPAAPAPAAGDRRDEAITITRGEYLDALAAAVADGAAFAPPPSAAREGEALRREAVAVLQSVAAHLSGTSESKVADCIRTIEDELDRQFAASGEAERAPVVEPSLGWWTK